MSRSKVNPTDGKTYTWRQSLLTGAGLFASLTTLICCALPALLVSLGLGAALAGLVSNAPWLIALSRYKEILFVVAGILILLAAYWLYRSRSLPCPTDPAQAAACAKLRRINVIVLGFTFLIYFVGFFFAFLAADIFY